MAIPPLEEEAKTFNRRKPLYALGCPLMPLYFHLDMLLQDDTAFIGAVLKGQSAVSTLIMNFLKYEPLQVLAICSRKLIIGYVVDVIRLYCEK